MNLKLAAILLSTGISFSANSQEVEVGDLMWDITKTLPKGERISTEDWKDGKNHGEIRRIFDKEGMEIYQVILQDCSENSSGIKSRENRGVLIGIYNFSNETYYADVESSYGNLPDGIIDYTVKNPEEINFRVSSCRTLIGA